MLELRWSSLSLSLQEKVAETSSLPGASSNPIWAVALRRGQPLFKFSLYLCGGGWGCGGGGVDVGLGVVVVYHIHHHVGA